MSSQARKNKETKTPGQEKKPSASDGFFTHFKGHVSRGDWQAVGAVEMEQMLKNFRSWAGKRRKGQHKIRVYNSTEAAHGWQAGNTIIEVVNDDMPFLIDSIAAELVHHNFQISSRFYRQTQK